MLLFNRYEYNPQTDMIGKGGFSKVYKALDKKLNRWLALKVYKMSELADRYGAIAEIQRVVNLDHPNICHYIDIEEIETEDSFGVKETIQICVMELLSGGDFAAYYLSHNNDNVLLRKLLIDVVKGLSYLHKNGVIHRDIKPANILIKETVEGPIAKITDFGISKRSDSTDHSSSSALIVSIPYMAPEQFNVKKYGIDEKVSFNIDFWSLGVTVYETITGDVLFKSDESDSREQVMNNIMLPDIPEKINILSEPFRSFVSTCIVKDAKERVQNPEDLLYILQSYSTNFTDSDNITDASDDEVTETTTLLIQRPEINDETQVLNIVKRDKEVEKKLPLPTISTPVPVPSVKESIFPFGRYDYNPQTALIGKGGFSRVYKAFDNKLSRWVALKIYKPGEFSEHYSPIAEIRRVVNLDHSNICRYLDMEEIERENSFGEKEKIQICVMELLDGGNFSQYYKAHNNLEILKKLLNDVLNGLSYLHKNGIIHRDIKPANILIKETLDGPVAKITDFGISKRSDAVNINTSSALIVSIPYMAPEQLNTKKYGLNEKITFNLDLWSLGVTIYEVITGKILFKNTDQDSPEQIMANIMAPDLPEKINELPQPFRKIVSHCIVKDAKARAQKAEELIVLLHSNFAEPIKSDQSIEWITASVITEKVPKKNTIEAIDKTTKPSFFIEKNKDEKIVPPVSNIKNNSNTSNKNIFIVLAFILTIVIFISIIVLISHKNNSPASSAPAINTATADSSKIKSAQDSERRIQLDNHPVSPAVSDQNVSDKIVPTSVPSKNISNQNEANEKTKRKNTGTEIASPRVGHNENSGGNQEYILIISTSETCSLKVDGSDYGIVKSGAPIKIYHLGVGNHSIEAVSTNKGTKVFNLPVTDDMLNKVGQVKISF